MTPEWAEDAWSKVGPELEEVARLVSLHRPDIQTSVEYRSTETVPLSMHVSFLADPAEDEVLVISAVVSVQGRGLSMTSDITRGDGTMIAEGAEVRVASDSSDFSSILSNWLASVVSFLRDSHSVMVSVLTRKAVGRE